MSNQASWPDEFWSDLPPLPADLRLRRLHALQPTDPRTGTAYDRALLQTPVAPVGLVLALRPGLRGEMVPRIAGELTTLIARLLARTHTAGELLAPCIATDWARPEVIEACRLHRLAVIDQTGALLLQAGAILIHLHGQGTRRHRRRRARVAFPATSTRIARVLAASPERTWKVRDVAGASGTSFGTSQAVLGSFEAAGWVSRRSPRSGFVLVDPGSLLRASLETGGPSWAALAGFYAPSTSPEALRAAREESARLGIPTLFTLASGLRPEELFVSGLPHAVYCSGDPGPLISSLRLKAVTPHNFLVVTPRRELDTESGGVYHRPRQLDHGPAAALPQLIADFWNLPGRGRDQAEHLLERYLESLPLRRV